MTPREIAIAITAEFAIFVAALGLIARGRWRLNVLFAIYIPVVLVCGVLTTFWPARFWTGSFWVSKHLAYDVLLVGVALEIGWRTFRDFRGAALIAHCYTAVVVTATMGAVASYLTGEYFAYMGQVHPRLVNGTIWLFAGTLVLSWWYRVPMRPFHMAIATSGAAYLGAFSTLLSLVGLYGYPAVEPYIRALDPAAFVLVAFWWAFVAWRRDTSLVVSHEETLERLHARLAVGRYR